jgi:hypothetical protein
MVQARQSYFSTNAQRYGSLEVPPPLHQERGEDAPGLPPLDFYIREV